MIVRERLPGVATLGVVLADRSPCAFAQIRAPLVPRVRREEIVLGSAGRFGQPGVLANLFGVELWERFSFYGMQGILLIYLYYTASQGGLGIDEGTATGIVGAYGGAVYLSTILGAWLADRLIGPERTLFYAAVCVMLGHVALSLLPGLAGVGVGLEGGAHPSSIRDADTNRPSTARVWRARGRRVLQQGGPAPIVLVQGHLAANPGPHGAR